MLYLIYDISIYPRWTMGELKDMIALLNWGHYWAGFDPTYIDTDLHKRVR